MFNLVVGSFSFELPSPGPTVGLMGDCSVDSYIDLSDYSMALEHVTIAVREDTHFRGSSIEVNGAHSSRSSIDCSARSSCCLYSEAKIDCIITAAIEMNAQELL